MADLMQGLRTDIRNDVLWTMKIEERLLAGDIDIIVYSLRDVLTVLPAGCALGVFPYRQDPTDAFVVRIDSSYRTGSVAGTSSVRRTAQLRHFYPYLNIQACRGNVSVSAPFKFPNCPEYQ